MEEKYLVVPAQLIEDVWALFISGCDDLAEVDPADERSKVKLKRGKEDVAEAMKLISVVPWRCNQEMWEKLKEEAEEAINERAKARTEEALKLGECGVWRIVGGELTLEG